MNTMKDVGRVREEYNTMKDVGRVRVEYIIMLLFVLVQG